MKIWVVRQDDWEEDGPLSVWSSRELAEAEMKRLEGPTHERLAIQEFTVDEPF